MRIFFMVFILVLSFNSIAKEVKYKYCQDAITNTFNLERLKLKQKILEQFEAGKPYKNEDEKMSKLNELYNVESYQTEGHTGAAVNSLPNKDKKPIFTVDKNHKLSFDKKKVSAYIINTTTGEYKFNIKDSENKNAIALGSFIVKKDEEGRIYSIEEQGNDLRCKNCKVRLEFTYSKNKCVAKKIISTDKYNNAAVVADAQVCKNLDSLKRRLYKNMKKMNKCMGILNEHYQKVNSVSDIMLAQISDGDNPNEKIIPGKLTNYLENIKSFSGELKEDGDELNNLYEKQRLFQKNYNALLDQCESYLGKNTVDARDIYKQDSGIFKIKKESTDRKVQKPYAGKVINN